MARSTSGRRLNSDQPWGGPIAVVDLETTGLSHANGDRIIEVAVIRLEGLNDPNPVRFSQLVNPQVSIPTASYDIHGIADSMVATAPVFADIIEPLSELLRGAVFVAHLSLIHISEPTRPY